MSQSEDAAYNTWVAERRQELQGDPERLAAFERLVGGGDDPAKNVFRGYIGGRAINQRFTELDQQKKALEANKEQWKNWEKDVRAQYAALQAENEALKRKMTGGPANEDELDLGDPDDEEDVSKLPDDVVRRADLDALLAKRDEAIEAIDSGSVFFAKDMAKVVRRSIKEGFDIDEDAIYELAAKEKLSPSQAYERMTKDERDKRAKEAHDNALKEAYERGKKEAGSKNTPDDMKPVNQPRPVVVEKSKLSRDERRAAALKTFQETPAQPND